MPYVEAAWNHSNIPVELSYVRPLGDFVLVRMLPEEEMHRNLIWLPQFSGAHGDRQLRPTLPSIGEVVAAGQGDPKLRWVCRGCLSLKTTTSKAPGKCSCGESEWDLAARHRHKMHVSPGDRIMYWRVPANEVILNDETFQFLHEEQHVLGVIENG